MASTRVGRESRMAYAGWCCGGGGLLHRSSAHPSVGLGKALGDSDRPGGQVRIGPRPRPRSHPPTCALQAVDEA